MNGKAKKQLYCCCFVVVLSFNLQEITAQTLSAREWYGDAKSMGMGDALLIAQSLLSDTLYLEQQNKTLSVERALIRYYLPYAQPSMAVKNLMIQVRSPFADFQLNLGQSGGEVFNESLLSLACTRSMTESIVGGFRLGMYRVAGTEPNEGTALLTECFVYYLLNTQWRLGAYMFNPIATRVSGIRLIQSYHLTCAYRPGPGLDFVIEMEKQQRQALQVHLGMESKCCKWMRLRFGLNYPLMQPALGLGLNWKKFSLDAACRLHQKMPPTYAMSLHYSP